MEVTRSFSPLQESPSQAPKQPLKSGQHPRKFDQDTLNQCTGTQLRLLELIQYDCKQTAKRSPSGAKYSIRPQNYFAKVLGVCRETISDAVIGLEKLGILDVTRRNKKNGEWQTNLYKIRNWRWWRFARCILSLRVTPLRVTKTSHLSTPKRGEGNQTDLKGGALAHFTQEILARWESKGIFPSPTRA